ncbi:Hypothetical_protein [Hexamita inflata]|uniref:Hypothetical_protein n=1 Tax=Hexamita inflata TaxID=28002 RepID=A0AA86PFZ5_9EUKA|nr:Hypothetical protein HINF_LOCUS22702 [Hexamita inflata]
MSEVLLLLIMNNYSSESMQIIKSDEYLEVNRYYRNESKIYSELFEQHITPLKYVPYATNANVEFQITASQRLQIRYPQDNCVITDIFITQSITNIYLLT